MEGKDYISCLPDLMLLNVLRFLPTVDAVRTVCVPRFRYLWKSLPNLSFNLCEFHRCSELGLNQTEFQERFIDFVNSALILHDHPTLDSFSLRMEFCFTEIGPDMVNGGNGIRPSRVSSMIGLWIHFALRKKVRILNLDFAGCQGDQEGEDPGSEYYVLPSIVLRSRSLVELYLDRCSVKLFGGIQLKSLRILSLTRVGLSDQMVNQILSGCPLLGELSLKKCSGLEHLKISGPTRLKKLDVAIANMNELDIALSSIEFLKVHADLMEIICPKITHLDIDMNEKHVRFSDLPSVIEATIFLNRVDMILDVEFPGVRLLLQKLRNVTSLKACAFCIMVFSIWESANHPRPCFNWTHLTTVLGFSKWAILGISRFLMSSPRLENLIIYAFPFCPYTDASSERTEPDDLDTGYDWSSVDGGTFHCLKDHLKNITIQGYITKPYIVDLIKFLLGNALVLEKMVISSESPPERYRKKYQYDCSTMQNPIPPISIFELSQLVFGFRRASAPAIEFVVDLA